jgi:replication-associated recombination protein RarA
MAKNWGVTYRPTTLDRVVGQPTAVNIISGFFKKKNLPNVLLLTGETGHGKTTLAYIIAAMANQVEYNEHDPDIVEINAASERGIEDMRNLIKNSNFLPQKKYKIIIIDEVQGLTRISAPPLLKPLEKPSSHVIWIMCTNEPHKMLDTLKGRATTIPLKRIEPEELLPLFKRVCKKEEVDFGKKHDKILLKTAEFSGGQPRKGLNLLQAVWSSYNSKEKGNTSELFAAAMEGMDEYQVEKAAIRMIVGSYMGSEKEVAKAISNCGDAAALINVALEMHKYLFEIETGSKTYHSYSRKELTKILKANVKKSPSLGDISAVHRQLTNIKMQSTLYSVKELDLAYAHMVGFAASRKGD